MHSLHSVKIGLLLSWSEDGLSAGSLAAVMMCSSTFLL